MSKKEENKQSHMVKRNSMLTNKLKQEGHDGPKALT
jgi:hypothetical protein